MWSVVCGVPLVSMYVLEYTCMYRYTCTRAHVPGMHVWQVHGARAALKCGMYVVFMHIHLYWYRARMDAQAWMRIFIGGRVSRFLVLEQILCSHTMANKHARVRFLAFSFYFFKRKQQKLAQKPTGSTMSFILAHPQDGTIFAKVPRRRRTLPSA